MEHKPPRPATFEIDISPKPPKPPGPYDTTTKSGEWLAEAVKLLSLESVPLELSNAFYSKWTEEGRHIRNQVGDDRRLGDLLRHVLPKYGGGDMVLYRGENINRFKVSRIGFGWTPDRRVAEMFGGGHNATLDGGVLLKVNAKAHWILAEPSLHSKSISEQEFVVDPSLLEGIEVLQEYPPSGWPPD